MWALALMSFVAIAVFRSLNSSTPTVAPRPPLVLDFWYMLLFMSFATVGALVTSRKPGNASSILSAVFLPIEGIQWE